ncbi:MAG TPA: hypothetical protein VFP65_17790 [Anaeromyxobacteraceae bacterium]|nr:hypothetical protein [Anaeromyxobacteraceae bacterium]
MTPFTESALADVGAEAARAAWAAGLTVLRPSGEVVPIPLVAEPAVFPRARLAALAAEARALLSGAVKLARALLRDGDARDREALLGPFQGLEAEAMARLFDEAPCPAIMARVDFLPTADPDAPPRALELNATIPAMSGYADLAAHAWLRAAARARGMTPRQANDLVAAAGSNMENLRRALCAFHASRGGGRVRPSIAVVARPGDAQIGELRRLVEHLRQMGHEAENLTPPTCEPERWDVLYRHVWAHKTHPDSPFARALRAPGRFVLANPVNGMLEAKALFARLSECGADAGLAARAGLDDGELAAARRLPVTRRLDHALAPRVIAERERWVLKRSWDYGGKSVQLGAETDPAAWERVVHEAAADLVGGGFVAQERVFAARRPATRIAPDGVTRAELYRDVSTYCGLGADAPSGSVVRAAASPIVNILGGGGLAPVLPDDVVERVG